MKDDIKKEMDNVIRDLESQGIESNSHMEDRVGLGDVVENTLDKFGITEEKFKEWFNLRNCNCSKRKAWLNNLFSWKKREYE
jgi:hypothetical protein